MCVKRGMFIDFEGPDAGGKTTVSRAMASLVPFGEYHKGPPEEIFGLRKEIIKYSGEVQYGYYMAGNAVQSYKVKEKLEKGIDIFCDRYIYSTASYFSVVLGRELAVPECILVPDLVVYLEADQETLNKRLMARGVESFHDKSLEDSKKERDQFERVLSFAPKVYRIDTSCTTPEEVAQHIKDMLKLGDRCR